MSALSARGRSQTMGAAGGLLPNTRGPPRRPGSPTLPLPWERGLGVARPGLWGGVLARVARTLPRRPLAACAARVPLAGTCGPAAPSRTCRERGTFSFPPSRAGRPDPGSAARVRVAAGRGAGERGAEQDSGISDADQGLGSRDAGIADADHDQPALYPRQSGIALFNLCQAISHQLLLPQF